MKHARMLAPLALAAAVAVALTGFAPVVEAAAKRSSKAASTESQAAPRKAAAYHQFTGTGVSLDDAAIMGEKGGRTPKQMVFTRHSTMRSTGDVAKDSRVTVYWRDEAGKPVAHRVVVKAAATSGTD